jgi:hypothetical protein
MCFNTGGIIFTEGSANKIRKQKANVFDAHDGYILQSFV